MLKIKFGLLTKILCRNGKTCSGIILCCALVIISCTLFFFAPFSRKFIILNYNTNKILYLSDVKSGDRFSITYIHSVNKSPIEDLFIIDDEYNIVLSKSIFKSFGAGVPSTFDDGGRFEFFDDRIEVSYNNRVIGKLILRIGTIADHRFMMDGKNIKLNELSEPQSCVCFLADRITLFQWLRWKVSNP